MKVRVERGSGRKGISQQVPGLSDVEEGVVHLEEELPGDVLQSQQVLFKQRNHQMTDCPPDVRSSHTFPCLSLSLHHEKPWSPIPDPPVPRAMLSQSSQETTR